MYAPVPNYARELTKPMVFNGVELLPGTGVHIHADVLHHNPAVWGEDHRIFKPERFLEDNMVDMSPFAFCPFSAGPR